MYNKKIIQIIYLKYFFVIVIFNIIFLININIVSQYIILKNFISPAARAYTILRAIHFLICSSFRWKLTSFVSRSECFSACYDNKMRSWWKLHRAASRRILCSWYTSLLIIRLFKRATANVYYFLPRAILFSAKCIAQVIIAATGGSLYYQGKFVILGRLINLEDIPDVCTYPDRLKRATLPFSKLRPHFILVQAKG